jgi:hypothetical protein
MNVIDVHAHVIVPELLRNGACTETWRPALRRIDGRAVVEFAGRRISSMVQEFVELDRILAAQERAGIEHVALSLKVLLGHGGGAIVSLAGRLRHGHEAIPAAGRALSEPADASIRRFLFDTVTHDPALLRALVNAVGADRVLLGSDYPFDMGDRHPVQTVRRAGLDEDDEAPLLSGNAQRLLAIGVS